MALRKVMLEGEPVLRKKAREVSRFDDRLKELAGDMIETMHANDGVGLAANQVGVLKRVFVMNIGDENGDVIVVNPRLLEQHGSAVNTEGCLSIPGYFGEVERPERVVLEAEDAEGKTFQRELTGLGAICVCHEMDHLDGILYRDRAVAPLEPLSAKD